MKIREIAVMVLLFAGSTAPLRAQDTPKAAPSASTLIGPNDGVAIVALNAEEISKTWRVNSSGDLTLPLVGNIHAAGMTTEQLEQELTTKLKQFVRDPEVTVYVTEFRSKPVTVTGAVEKPGTIQMEGPKTLLGVLMLAGGTKTPGPTVTVTREMKYGMIPLPGAKVDSTGSYSTVEVAIGDVQSASSPSSNLEMQPDDVVSVSMQQRLVYIMGEVNRPGVVELVTQDRVSIVQVLAAAGGTTRTASASKTTVMHMDASGHYSPASVLDLKKILSGKTEDTLLVAGDVVIVPSSTAKLYAQAATMSVATGGAFMATSFLTLMKY